MSAVDLGWIRVFVEVGRAGSLSGAARALGLTQPAVSYQIRRAEAEIGAALLRRLHRGVELTETGRELFDTLSRAVQEVDRLAGRLRGGAAARLVVHADYAFSGLWLIPRIHRFREAHPMLDIQIVAAQRTDPAALRPGETGIVFGARARLGAEATLLLPERVLPVCAPGVAEALADPLAEAPLVHLDGGGGPGRWFSWSDYFAAQGARRAPAGGRGDLRFNTYSLVIEAALAGEGVALGWRGLVDPLLRRGALVPVGPALAAAETGYFLIQAGPGEEATDRLRRWLIAEAAAGEAAAP